MVTFGKDERLEKVTDSQYRIWADSQKVLIPRGESTSNPISKEIVMANTNVNGQINQGYFNKALVQFTNCEVKPKIFDSYYLFGYRDGTQLPLDNEDIDIYEDLKIDNLILDISMTFSILIDDDFNSDVVFSSSGNYGVIMTRRNEFYPWRTTNLTTTSNYEDYILNVDYYIVFDEEPPYLDNALGVKIFDISDPLQVTKLKPYIVVTNVKARYGATEFNVLRENIDNQFYISSHSINVKGGF